MEDSWRLRIGILRHFETLRTTLSFWPPLWTSGCEARVKTRNLSNCIARSVVRQHEQRSEKLYRPSLSFLNSYYYYHEAFQSTCIRIMKRRFRNTPTFIINKIHATLKHTMPTWYVGLINKCGHTVNDDGDPWQLASWNQRSFGNKPWTHVS